MPLFPSRLLLAPLLACTLLSPVWAIDLPPAPADPQLNAAMNQARAAFEKISTNGFMEMPRDNRAWPCTVSELQLRRWTGHMALADDEQDEKARKAAVKAYRASGMAAGELKTTIRDVRHVPIAANCKDNQLDGPLEFMIEYTRSIDTPTLRMESRTRTRMLLTVANGATLPAAAHPATSIQLSQKNTFKDPATEAMMQKVKQPEIGMALAAHVIPVSADTGYSAVITETRVGNGPREWMTVVSQPTGPQGMVSTSYRGSALWMVMRMKNSQMHGEMRTYPATFSGVQVPGTTRCYEDGEEIKTTQCNIE
jgi:hypothetical protein